MDWRLREERLPVLRRLSDKPPRDSRELSGLTPRLRVRMLVFNFGLTGTVSCGMVAIDGRLLTALRVVDAARAVELEVGRSTDGDIDGRPVAGAELERRPLPGVAAGARPRVPPKRSKVGVAGSCRAGQRAFLEDLFGVDEPPAMWARFSPLNLGPLLDRRGVLLAPRGADVCSMELRVRLDTGPSAPTLGEVANSAASPTDACASLHSSVSCAFMPASARMLSVSFDLP